MKEQIIEAVSQELKERSNGRGERFPSSSDHNVLSIITSALKRIDGKFEIIIAEGFNDDKSRSSPHLQHEKTTH